MSRLTPESIRASQAELLQEGTGLAVLSHVRPVKRGNDLCQAGPEVMESVPK